MEALKQFCLIFFHFFRELFYFVLPTNFRQKNIADDVALITGAGSGLGRAIALELADKVKHVILWDIDERSVRITSRLVKALGGRCSFYVLDIANASAVNECERTISEKIGPVTILISNAAIMTGASFFALKDEDIVRTYEVNLYAQFWIFKAFLPQMQRLNKGHFVTILDGVSFASNGVSSDYNTTKAAAVGLFESLLLETKDAGYDGIEFTMAIPSFMTNRSTKTIEGEASFSYTAAKIIEAMRANIEVVAVPKSMNLYLTFVTMFPSKSAYMLYRALGGTRFIRHFCFDEIDF